MQQQNRPYSLQNIFDNLHGIVPKTQLQRILDDVAEKGILICKVYGKFKLYLIEQSRFAADPNTNTISDADLDVSRQSVKEQKKANELLSDQPADNDLKRIYEEILVVLEQKERELAHNESRNVRQLSKEELQELAERCEVLRRDEARCRKACLRLLDYISEMTNMTVSDVRRELGIDTDGGLDIQIQNDDVSQAYPNWDIEFQNDASDVYPLWDS
eukprot:GHVO01015109.1.p2 GENE.GHVO01015109.1~~GHVO01015109.1.p2  ORF type:complete len:216 (+),score=47.89 GHVO01015109.1:572-1219(+)